MLHPEAKEAVVVTVPALKLKLAAVLFAICCWPIFASNGYAFVWIRAAWIPVAAIVIAVKLRVSFYGGSRRVLVGATLGSIAVAIFSMCSAFVFAYQSFNATSWMWDGLEAATLTSLHSLCHLGAALSAFLWIISLGHWLRMNPDGHFSEIDLDAQTPSIGDDEFPRTALRLLTIGSALMSVGQVTAASFFVKFKHAYVITGCSLVLCWAVLAAFLVFMRPRNQRLALATLLSGVFFWLSQFMLTIILAFFRDAYSASLIPVNVAAGFGWANWVAMSAWLGFGFLWFINAREDKNEEFPSVVMPVLSCASGVLSLPSLAGVIAAYSVDQINRFSETDALWGFVRHDFSAGFSGSLQLSVAFQVVWVCNHDVFVECGKFDLHFFVPPLLAPLGKGPVRVWTFYHRLVLCWMVPNF